MHSIILKDQWNKINEKSFWRRLQGKELNFSLEANWLLLFVCEPKSLFSHPWVMSSEDFKDLILVFSEFPQIACWMHYLQWRSFFKYIAFGEKKLKMTVSGRRSLNEMGAVRQRILVKIVSYARIVCRLIEPQNPGPEAIITEVLVFEVFDCNSHIFVSSLTWSASVWQRRVPGSSKGLFQDSMWRLVLSHSQLASEGSCSNHCLKP